MALPPEPLDEVLNDVVLAVIGRVVRAERVEVDSARRAIGAAGDRPAQAIEVEVEEVLRGEAAGVIKLTKPSSAYVLVEGVSGAFLADADSHLLGRQGPDSWPVDAVRTALAPKSGGKR
jgi:hypothetical protein